jgi:hypothetical protein
MDVLFAWILSFMTTFAPPGRKVVYPEAAETQEEAVARYESITKDVVTVVYNPSTKPLFTGPNGRAQTVSVVLSIMDHEASFMKNVDYGLGKYARGDGGRSFCMMQIKTGTGKTIPWNTAHDRPIKWNDPEEEIFRGYTGEELIADRKLCIQEGLKILRLSFGQCHGLPLEDRLRSYASGNCNDGAAASHNRMNTAMNWFAGSYGKTGLTDAKVEAALNKAHFFDKPADPDAKKVTDLLSQE